MILPSVYEKYHLSPLANGSFTALGIDHPLQLVPAQETPPSETDDLMIICLDYDRSKRLPMEGVERVNAECTHVFFWLLSKGGGAQCFSFGAACVADALVDGKIQHLRPDLRHEYVRLFGGLKDLNAPISNAFARLSHSLGHRVRPTEQTVRLVLHRNLRECLEGVVYDESFRVADVTLSIALTPEQMSRARRKVREWQENTPTYQIVSKDDNKNCGDLLIDVADAAGVTALLPRGFCLKPYPGVMSYLAERMAAGKLFRAGTLQIAPSAVTAAMLPPARAQFLQRHHGQHDNQIRTRWGGAVDDRYGFV